jgi:UDP-N-acetylglucosamine 1-carboxyvinyltransferase
MREYVSVFGGKSLNGEVKVSGAKNSALPLLIATLLSSSECEVSNVPDLDDIDVTLRLLKAFGAEVQRSGSTVKVNAKNITTSEAPHSLIKAMRASFWVLGPVLARTGQARVSLPGGDAIGQRPVDLHLNGLHRMGADIRFQNGSVIASAPGGLTGAMIDLDFPSVGATHQLIMTAALTEGETVISGAAREPEIVEVAQFLQSMGAEIEGAGTPRVVIRGKKVLGGGKISVIGDRIEAATYLAAGAMTHGTVTVSGIDKSCLSGVLQIFEKMGCQLSYSENGITLSSNSHQAINFDTAPFPGVATDTQPMLLAAMTNAEGEAKVTETIFENRFGHAVEFKKFGANISISGRCATVKGVSNLHGAIADAGDIRAAAALVLMGLVSEGESQIYEIHHLDRGYERMVEKFRALGAEIRRVPAFDGQEHVIGC